MTESDGAYLIAFLALFVRMAGQHSWGIVRYVIFRARQKGIPSREPLQSVLRNEDVDTFAAWELFKLSRRPSRLTTRCIFYTLLALIHASVFIAAGIFVSKVTATGKNEVLLRGHTCGIWQNPASWNEYSSGTVADLLENDEWVAYNFGSSTAAATFSRQCYNTTAADSALANCNAYAPSLLIWDVEETSCPFDEKMCQNGTTIRLDSGLLDSLHDFGVNAPHHDRIKYRRVVECSPLTRDGYVTDFLNASQVHASLGPQTSDLLSGPQEGIIFQEYQYGSSLTFNMSSTYVWNNATLSGTDLLGNSDLPQFLIDAEISMLGVPGDSTFQAIDALNRSNADIIIYFLNSAITYMEPVNDPWFQASIPFAESTSLFANNNRTTQTIELYSSNYPASVMGCTQQNQYCNHDGSKCSILTGQAYGGGLPESITAFAQGLDLNAKQNATLNRLVQASYNQGMYTVGIQNTGLLAQETVADSFAPPLPDNQWILEMQHYFLTGLTAIQMQLTDFVTGPSNPAYFQYLKKPNEDDEWMCTSQIVQRSGYATFSVLGIAVVIGFGGLVMLINVALPSIGSHLTGEDSWGEYHHLETCSDAESTQYGHSSRVTNSKIPNFNESMTDTSMNEVMGAEVPKFKSTYENNFSESLESDTISDQSRTGWMKRMFTRGSRKGDGQRMA